MLDRVFALAAWAILAFIAYATLSPIQDRPTMASSPVLEHLAAFAALGALFRLGYPRKPLFACLIVGASAVLLELLQNFLPSRHARLEDLAEKLLGGCLGLALASLLIWFLAGRFGAGKVN
jgi:VanZ family protein